MNERRALTRAEGPHSRNPTRLPMRVIRGRRARRRWRQWLRESFQAVNPWA